MRRIAALAIAGVVLVLLAVSQLVLPRIAEQRLRDRLSQSGRVLEVRIEAFPAIELLWHQADKVVVRLARYSSSPAQLSSLLDQASDVGSLDASATELGSGLLSLHDATLAKRGSELTGSAQVTEAALRAAIPFLDGVQPVASAGGRLTLRGTATLLGLTASVDATIGAQDGKLVVQPDVPFGGLATVTVFSNPHVAVQGVGATPIPGGFSVSARARLR